MVVPSIALSQRVKFIYFSISLFHSRGFPGAKTPNACKLVSLINSLTLPRRKHPTRRETSLCDECSCRIKFTGDLTEGWREARAHFSVRACARRAARTQLRLRRRVAECIPLRLRAAICGPVEVGVGCAAPGWPATRLSRPAHARAAIWSPGGRAACPRFNWRRAPCSSQRHSSHSAHCGSAPTAAPQKAIPSVARCAAAAACAHAALHASTYARVACACAKAARGGRGGGCRGRVRASGTGLSQIYPRPMNQFSISGGCRQLIELSHAQNGSRVSLPKCIMK